MEQFFVYGTTIILGALLFGLLLYSFYIVLTSKDENYKKTKADSAETMNNTVSLEEHLAISDNPKTPKPTNKPPQKTPTNKKGKRKAA